MPLLQRTLESTRILDIEKFVPRATIDRLYRDMPYHLVPSGKTGIEAFAVIREAMRQKDMVALGRLVMSTRERLCAIEIEEDALLMTTLPGADTGDRTSEQRDRPHDRVEEEPGGLRSAAGGACAGGAQACQRRPQEATGAAGVEVASSGEALLSRIGRRGKSIDRSA